jgi:hypothetical protein
MVDSIKNQPSNLPDRSPQRATAELLPFDLVVAEKGPTDASVRSIPAAEETRANRPVRSLDCRSTRPFDRDALPTDASVSIVRKPWLPTDASVRSHNLQKRRNPRESARTLQPTPPFDRKQQ